MRTRFRTLAMGVALTLTATLSLSVTTSAAHAAGEGPVHAADAPALQLANPTTAALLGPSHENALVNLLDINQVSYDEGTYNSTGFLSGSTFFRAGGGYAHPWTRDAAVNSWNAGSMLAPGAARNTLWSVVKKPSDESSLIVQQDNQWWDQVVWTVGAWNHYLVTGDEQFLADAYTTASNTIAAREATQYNSGYGLFMGPSFFNDGIAGYPDAVLDGGDEGRGSSSFSYPWVKTELALSTNTLYYEAYVDLANMAQRLDKPSGVVAGHEAKATALKAAINEHFWQPSKGYYGYVITTQGPQAGVLQDYQEGTGLAFSILFGIADAQQTASIIESTHTTEWGITDVWPRFTRYVTAGHPGRHNDIVWPMVQGYWASAAAKAGAQDVFANEVVDLARLHDKTDSFYEIYHGDTGAVDGGYQTGRIWESKPDQTWSATAFLRMIYEGVFGMGYTPGAMTFSPTLPVEWGDMTLDHVRYRGADLTVRLHGSGDQIADFRLDGAVSGSRTVPATLTGAHTVDITLTGGMDGDRDGDGVPDSTDECPDASGGSGLEGCPVDDDDQDGVLGDADLCQEATGPAELQGCVDPELIEAEDTRLHLAVTSGDAHAGYSGTGFVGTMYTAGDSITFDVYHPEQVAASGTVRVRYANGQSSAKRLSLYADGVKVRQVSFPQAGPNWDTWAWYDLTDVPMSGDVTTVSLRVDSGDNGRANIDAFSYVPGNVVIPQVEAPQMVVGSAYAHRWGAVGGNAPYSFAVTGGSLPDGVSFSADGTVSGTPTVFSPASFTVTATDSTGRTGSRTITLTAVQPVLVTAVTVTGPGVSGGAVSLEAGAGLQLTAALLPEDATDRSVRWGSDASGIASISASGQVTAIAAGTAVITATANDGSGASGSVIVTVTDPVPEPSSDASLASLSVAGLAVDLVAAALPEGASLTVADPAVVTTADVQHTVSDAGASAQVEIASGAVTVTVTAEDGTTARIYRVVLHKAVVPVSAITVTGEGVTGGRVTLVESAGVSLSAVVAPSGATDASVSWSTGDASVATVSADGQLLAARRGTTVVTATANDGSGVSGSVVVTVTAALPWQAPTATTLKVTPTVPRLGAKGTATVVVTSRITSGGVVVTSGTVRFVVGRRQFDSAVRHGLATATVVLTEAGSQPITARYLGTSTTAPSAARSSVKVAKAPVKVRLEAKKVRKAVKKALRKGAAEVSLPLVVTVAGAKAFAPLRVRVKGKGLKARTVTLRRAKAKIKVRLTKKVRRQHTKKLVVRVIVKTTAKVAGTSSKKVVVKMR